MFDLKAAARLPGRSKLMRNGVKLHARRVALGAVDVRDNALRIADADEADEPPGLPLCVPDGEHGVYAFQWEHSGRPVNVCAVISFRLQLFAVARPLSIDNRARPDLSEGVIVDSGNIRIAAASSLTMESGLGDGYYPVYAVRNFGLVLQAIVVDFEVWRVRNVILLDHQELDEFGFVRNRA